jgi:hypothetical protein
MMKAWKAAVCVVGLGAILGGGSAAMAAGGSPAPGKIKVFVTQVNSTKSKVLITGAIGDYGTGVSTDKNGKVNPNGSFQKITLKQGGFVVDATGLNKGLSHASPQINRATCSTVFSGSGPGTLEKGTGLYRGIGGKVTITVTFAGIAPRFTSGANKGQCNFGQNVQQLGSYQSITATGRVTFS